MLLKMYTIKWISKNTLEHGQILIYFLAPSKPGIRPMWKIGVIYATSSTQINGSCFKVRLKYVLCYRPSVTYNDPKDATIWVLFYLATIFFLLVYKLDPAFTYRFAAVT